MLSQDSLPASKPTGRLALVATWAAFALVGGSCGGSSLSPDTVTLCTEDQCMGLQPLAEQHVCSDGFVAGPACIKALDGTCDWAVLTCGVKRGQGETGGAGTAGTGGIVGTGGHAGSGGLIGSGGVIATGGIVGSGGRVATGGIIGSGGMMATGGIIGSGGAATGGIFGTGGFFGTGGSGIIGSFSWTGQGQSYSAPGYYDENLALSGKSFVINIAVDYQFTFVPCHLTGQFPSVPPPPGTYPITNANSPQADGTFVGRCSVFFGMSLVDGDPSISGTVTLSQSGPGDVEGVFTMTATPSQFNTGTGGFGAMGGGMTAASATVNYTGAFAVGCRDGLPLSDPACAARTIVR
jgi:hypothetical protein